MPDRPLICATVTAPTMAVLRARRDAAGAADLVEVRLDSVGDPDVSGALQGRRGPVLVTCRPSWEGGAFQGSEDERERILTAALSAGAEFVDVEWRAAFRDRLMAATGGRRVVLSQHDFDGVPPDLCDRVRAMRASGAQVVKMAVQAQRLADMLPLLEAGRQSGADGGLVTLAMGTAGLASRVLAARFGSCWTYAGGEAQLGQVPVERLLHEFRFRAVTPATAVYGLVGAPVQHSVSPAMHNAAFAAAGLDAVYVPFEAAGADDFLAVAGPLDVRGASVTIPFKQDLLARVAQADAAARDAGALNTLKRVGGQWLGANTDVAGFLAPLEGRVELRGLRATVLGAGGAARAVVDALARAGAREILIFNRSLQRAKALGEA
ncbi:MAG: type I 3-dehydroquinate dehydratase, partial [Acidobacteriota bacterium]|nr:type I 3-dehydroquinate dehydratase [Acidobacteriota bacterium]